MATKRDNYIFSKLVEVLASFFKLKNGSYTVTFTSATLTQDRTVTFPDADITVGSGAGTVTPTSVDTFENKTMSGNDNAFSDIPISSIAGLSTALSSKIEAAQTVTLTNKTMSGANNIFSNIPKSAVGLSNVDNTSDLAKPISTATQNALDVKQNIISVLDSTDSNYIISTSDVNRHIVFDSSIVDITLQGGAGLSKNQIVKITCNGATPAIIISGVTVIVPASRFASSEVMSNGTITITCLGTDIYSIEGDTQ